MQGPAVATRPAWRSVLLFCLGLLLSHGAAARAQTLQPLRSEGEILAAEIYDAARWTLRVPYELAYPYLVRLKLDPYVDKLPLAPDVRRRLRAHIRSREFVDETIPFLMAIRDTYSAPESVETFDTHLRRRFTPAAAVPGIEHSMFRWQETAAETTSTLTARDKMAAQLVTLYDALFLRDADGERRLGQRFICDRPVDDKRVRLLLQRARPLVRNILRDTLAELDANSDLAAGVRGLLDDAQRLDAITVSVIDVSRQQICKHYRVFATRVFRSEQLRHWLTTELHKPDGGRLWEYLEEANTQRRYAVHVIVDGLQGHMVEALAGGANNDPFLKTIWREQQAAEATRPPSQPTRPAPPQSVTFLEHIATRGFQNPDYLPFFRGLAGAPGIARVGISTTPTISARNVPIVSTGAPIAGNGGIGIPNFHFIDRHYGTGEAPQGRAYYFYGNDAALMEELTRAAGMRTMFERLGRFSSFNCGSQYDRGAHYTIDGLLNLGLGEKSRDFGETRCIPELERRARNETKLRAMRSRLLQQRPLITKQLSRLDLYRRAGKRNAVVLAERDIAELATLEPEGLPQYVQYYNPWPDHFAHFKGPFSDEIVAPSGELNRLDYWLGRLDSIYAKAGVKPRTLFGMAGDHGLAPVFHMLNPEVAIFDRLRDRGIDLRIMKISSDEGEGPRLTNRLAPPSIRGVDAVVASTAGGNYMIDFFKDQQGGWAQQPLYAELEHLQPINGGSAINMPAEIYAALHQTLDYMVIRERPCDPTAGTVRLVGERSGQRSDAWIERRGPLIYYRYDPKDLLDTDQLTPYELLRPEQIAEHARLHQQCVVAARGDEPSTWCNEDEWRLLTSFTPRPDSVAQLAHIYDLDTPGTVNLFPRTGIGYNTIVPGRHAGESFHEKDAFVGVWGGPVGNSGERLRTAVNGAPAMALHEYLTGKPARPGEDGWGYPSLGVPAGEAR